MLSVKSVFFYAFIEARMGFSAIDMSISMLYTVLVMVNIECLIILIC